MMGSISGRGETLTAVHSTLRESFLASDLAENHRSLAGITLAAILDNERKSVSNNSTMAQTLFDIIRTEEPPANHTTNNHPTEEPPANHTSSNHLTTKKTWKSFRERLKLRRNNNTSNSTGSHNNQNPQSDTGTSASRPQIGLVRRVNSFGSESETGNVTTMLGSGDQIPRRSSSMRLYDALTAEREMIRVSNVEPAEEEPSRMSLMELLEDPTEQQAGIEGPANQSNENEDESREEDQNHDMVEEEEKGEGALMAEIACCVCMVKPKGAAFIPCGHTFCRMCSRELWVKRGNCPLCNNSILEILDIF